MMDKRNIRVLIADDNKEFCNIISDVISFENGMTVEGVANDGMEALKLIREKKPDIALLDMIMPNPLILIH
jgi:two-component system, response regulator, stage 0 sporulation protein A